MFLRRLNLAVVLGVIRFYKNLFTKEGYLTFTLPVTSTQHILVKSTTAVLVQIVSIIAIMLSFYVFTFPKFKDKDIAAVFLGFVYVTVLLSYVFRVRSMTAGIFLSFFILISSWGNDVFAYFVGSAIGRHKFSPKVSLPFSPHSLRILRVASIPSISGII